MAALVAVSLSGACAPAGTTPEPARPEPIEEEREPRPEVAAEPPIIGVLVPLTGPAYLQRYGELIREGAEIAAAQASDAPAARLVVLDDEGDPQRGALLVRELEAAGVVGIVGPLLAEAARAVANARADPAFVLVSPTASEPLDAPNVYSLNQPDPSIAGLLARFALAEGLRRVALLYPRLGEHEYQARAFAETFRAGGGEVVADEGYLTGTTTFAEQMETIAADSPDALLVAAPERDLRQIAPQIAYYGVDPAQVRILGSEEWTSDVLRSALPNARIPEVIAVATALRRPEDPAWRAFVDAYETQFRRRLDNPYPALGYDAVRLLLAAADGADRDADDVARRFASLAGVTGATGVFSVEQGVLRRRPLLVRVRTDGLIPLDGSAGGAGVRQR
ncbi:MAG: ABC transporter substrate-binding protein [Longimicrobiales bacterium]